MRGNNETNMNHLQNIDLEMVGQEVKCVLNLFFANSDLDESSSEEEEEETKKQTSDSSTGSSSSNEKSTNEEKDTEATSTPTSVWIHYYLSCNQDDLWINIFMTKLIIPVWKSITEIIQLVWLDW